MSRCPPLAVSMSTRVPASDASARISRQSSRPLRRGSMMSRRTRCGRKVARSDRASSPSLAARASKPALRIRNSSEVTMLGSSSAISTRLAMAFASRVRDEAARRRRTPAGRRRTPSRAPARSRTQSRPPKWPTMRRQIASPSPVPAGFSVSVSPTCRNFSKIRSWFSALIPTPLSSTSTRTVPASPVSRTSTRPVPGVQNLAAFDSRFRSTCIRRSRSARTTGTEGASARLDAHAPRR